MKEDIRNIVREVLKEKGLLDSPADKPAKNRVQRPRSAPAVLSVFHAGVHKLDQALERAKELLAEKGLYFSLYNLQFPEMDIIMEN